MCLKPPKTARQSDNERLVPMTAAAKGARGERSGVLRGGNQRTCDPPPPLVSDAGMLPSLVRARRVRSGLEGPALVAYT